MEVRSSDLKEIRSNDLVGCDLEGERLNSVELSNREMRPNKVELRKGSNDLTRRQVERPKARTT